jgi:hypothetical protein
MALDLTSRLPKQENGADMRPTRIETLDDVRQWIADNDGRMDAYWEAQRSFNKRIEGEVKARDALIELRLTAVERRVIYLSGLAAGVGGLIGTLVSGVLTGS